MIKAIYLNNENKKVKTYFIRNLKLLINLSLIF